MMDVLLHTGTEHPETSWILFTAVLSFLAGLGVGLYAAGRDRLLDVVSDDSTR